ncbi:MAG: biotin--[acetyl-CoA-carboxylase] ligase [Bacteroidetes bacterium]|jgi:BirA family biotin operon repressor/biotin-[acetyl-CoA-carboxylase] ligase|nr:biotin--[acetyl-CoA-carboxylase] ligase [Bacteroidota bacterium]
MFDIKYIEEVDSTNITLWELLKNGEPVEGTVILSDYQHHGRGQQGNSWHSEKSLNLLASVFLKPEILPVDYHFYLSKIVSLGIIDALKHYGITPRIKWPNDILVDKQKICGILIENTLEGSIIKQTVAGIGMNVNQTGFPDYLPNATSIYNQINGLTDIADLLRDILKKIWMYYTELKQNSFELIDELYRNNLFGYYSWLTYIDKTGTFRGQIIGARADGALRIRKENGEVHQYYFKEVEWLNSECP